jgi:hypothetical protein
MWLGKQKTVNDRIKKGGKGRPEEVKVSQSPSGRASQEACKNKGNQGLSSLIKVSNWASERFVDHSKA